MKPQPVSEQDIQPHSIWQSIILHLLPGVLLLVFFVLAVPFVETLGSSPPLCSHAGRIPGSYPIRTGSPVL